MKLPSSAFLIALFWFTHHLNAASVTITSTATCTTDLGTVITTSSCTLADSLGNTFTASDVSNLGIGPSYSLSGNSLTVNVGAYTSEHIINPPPSSLGNLSANATSTITINFVTAGPVRSGYVELVGGNGVGFAGINGGGGGGASFGFNGGTIQSCYGTGRDPLCSLLFTRPGNSNFIRFTLGTETQFSGSASGGVAFDGAFNGVGYGAVVPQLLFFEADQTTPVDVLLATPEPRSWLFLSIGFGALLTVYKLNRFEICSLRAAKQPKDSLPAHRLSRNRPGYASPWLNRVGAP